MRSSRFIGAAALFLLLWAGQGALARDDAPAGYHRHYWKARIPLRLDGSRIAILQRAGRSAAQRGVPALGIAPAQVQAWPIAGWSLVPAGDVAREAGPKELEARIGALLQDDTIDFASPVFLDDEGGPLIITPDVLIGFGDGVDEAGARAILEQSAPGSIVEAGYGGMNGVFRVRGAARSGLAVLDIANALAQRDDVRYAEPDLIFTGRGGLIPNDPGFGTCWGLHNTGQFGGAANADMDAPGAWDITTGDASVKVVIIDTGVQQDHPDIHQIAGIDVTTDAGTGGPVNEFDFHGTPVAGCVSAIINNGIGTVGVAPGCVSVSARTFIGTTAQGNWTSQSSWTVNTLVWAEMIGARITNNSNMYGGVASPIIDDKYAQTHASGMIHFASAGNAASTIVTYPASLGPVNGVAALNSGGVLASFSNRGVGLDFAAPGELIYSTSRGSSYGLWSGTSFASPYTAGVAALVLSFNPFLSATDVEGILQDSCRDLGDPDYDLTYGWGFVNAMDALLMAPAPAPPGAFSLTAPGDGAVDVGRRPTLSWESAPLAQTYRVQIDDDPGFASPLLDYSGVTALSFTPASPLAASTTYYWRVFAENGLGSSTSTETFSFVPLVSPPGAFSLTSPPPGQSAVGLMPTFFWTESALAEGYAFVFDDNADFSSPLASSMTTATQFAYPGSLVASSTYYWSVTASNPIGSTGSTPTTASFETVGPPPGAFGLLSPPDGPNVPTTTPTLSWSAAALTESYDVHVDDDVGFGSLEVNVTGHSSTSYMVPGGVLSSGIRFYWRVYAVNEGGITLSTPSARSFGVLVPNCQGDSNRDGVVNFTDVITSLASFGTLYPGSTGVGDANFDGIVNFTDVLIVLGNFGVTCPA